jgi:threonine/homoserine/homoserine lactone efflux protein
VIALGALAAFTTGEGEVVSQTAVIASVLAAACFASVAIWAGFGAAIARFLGSPRARKVFNWSMAGLLAVSLLPVFR